MTIFHLTIVWLIVAVVSILPLLLAALQVRHYWIVVEMRLVLAACAGQALSQGVAAVIALTALSIGALDRPASPWLIALTIGNIAAVLPLVILALRMLRYRLP